MNKLLSALLLASCLLYICLFSPPLSHAMIEEDRSEEIKLKSSSWSQTRQRADLLIEQKKYAEAEKLIKQILDERISLALDLASERSALAEIYEKMHEQEKAGKEWETLIAEREKQAGGQDDITVAFALSKYAEFLSRTGKSAEAAKYKSRAETVQSQSLSTDADKRLAAKIRNEKTSPEERAEKLRKLGADWLLKCDSRKAHVYLNEAISLSPANAAAYCDRAEAYYYDSQDKLALKDFARAKSLDPKLARAYYDTGNLYRGQNKIAQAISQYNLAIELDKQNIDYLGARAKLFDMSGKHKQAISDYTKVLEIRPSCIWARVQRATAYENSKDWSAALQDLSALAERYPRDPDYFEYRGKTYLASGQAEKAIADYSKVIELSPNYAGGYLGRARAYESVEGKNSKKAKDDFAMARKYGYR